MSPNKRVCVVGAGPSGIAAAKNCVLAGLDVVVFEKGDKVGGNWVFNSKTGHSSVYENTHIISSKVWSEYEDFPMPDDYPIIPARGSCRLILNPTPGASGLRAHPLRPCRAKDYALASGDWRVEFTDAEDVGHVEHSTC